METQANMIIQAWSLMDHIQVHQHQLWHASYFYASDTVLETLWQRFRHTFLCILLTKYSNVEA